MVQKNQQKSLSQLNREYIVPNELFGYNQIEKDYLNILSQFNLHGNNILLKEENKIDQLTKDMVGLLSNNKEKIYGISSNDNHFKEIMYAEIRPYHVDEKSTGPAYLALEIYFKSLLSDKIIDTELEEIGDWRIQNSAGLRPEKLQYMAQSSRDFIIQRVSMIPWVHINISDNKKWQACCGIEIYSVDVNDDCGYAHFKNWLNPHSEIVLNSLNEEGKLEKISKDAYRNNNYEIRPFKRFTSGPLGPYDLSKRLEVVPFMELSSACSDVKDSSLA